MYWRRAVGELALEPLFQLLFELMAVALELLILQLVERPPDVGVLNGH